MWKEEARGRGAWSHPRRSTGTGRRGEAIPALAGVPSNPPPASCPAPSASGDGRDESPGRVRGSTVGGRGGIANDGPSWAPAAVLRGRARAFDPKVPTWWSAHLPHGAGLRPHPLGEGDGFVSAQRAPRGGRPAAPCTPQPGGPQAPPRLSLQVPPSPSCASWAPLPPAMAQGSAEGTQCREDHSAGHQGEFLARAGIQGQRQGLIMAQG